MEKRTKQIAELLKVLANENRLMIFCALMEKPLTVGEVAKHVTSISPSGLSQHLSMLKAHNILDSKKSGQSITYSIADHQVEGIIHVLQRYYCSSEEVI